MARTTRTTADPEQLEKNRRGMKGKLPFSPKRGRPTAEQAAAITETILTAARERFLMEGYDATTMEAIAKVAGVPKSTLYKRYPDKMALFRAVFEERINAWSAIGLKRTAKLEDNLEKRLKQRVRSILDWQAEEEVRAFSRLALGVWDGAAEVYQVMYETGYSAMIHILEQDIRDFGGAGKKAAKNPRRVAMALMALTSGWILSRKPGQTISRQEAAEFTDWAVEMLMYGKTVW